MRIISGKARGTKLYTLEGMETTRPTLDRVKESVFNIIQNDIPESTVLDLFAGSGAIGLEFASRGAKEVILCDKSKDAAKVIQKNIEKTHFEETVKLYNCDFQKLLEKISHKKIDIVYIDPPYKTDYIKQSLEIMLNSNMLDENSLIIAETDELERVLNEIENINLKIIDQRKYGRANIIFFNIG